MNPSSSERPPLYHVSFHGLVYRVARIAPFTLPDPRFAGNERLDDPRRQYRVLYGANSAHGAFVEKLQDFRPDPRVLAELPDDEGGSEDLGWIGRVPAKWREQRCLGVAEVSATLVDLGHSDTLAHLRRAVGASWIAAGLGDFDAATIRLGEPRAVTQAASRYIFDSRNGSGQRVDGVIYGSRFGDDIRNIALFEPIVVGPAKTTRIDPKDPEFLWACSLHGLRPEG